MFKAAPAARITTPRVDLIPRPRPALPRSGFSTVAGTDAPWRPGGPGTREGAAPSAPIREPPPASSTPSAVPTRICGSRRSFLGKSATPPGAVGLRPAGIPWLVIQLARPPPAVVHAGAVASGHFSNPSLSAGAPATGNAADDLSAAPRTNGERGSRGQLGL